MARILVIDDNILICKTLQSMLEREGYQVAMATTGLEALADLRQTPADLVITDIFMPDQDGIGTIMDICNDFPEMKIIAISGGGRLESIDYLELAHNVGAHRIFNKPFSSKELLGSVQDLLR